MIENTLLQLKNGSDLRGIALSTNKHAATLTEEVVCHLAYGMIQWIQEKGVQGPIKIAIGHDSRLSAKDLQGILFNSFAKFEVELLDVDLATTPALFYATQFETIQADLAIMITASHLPFEYNGFKLFTQAGGVEHEDIDRIVECAIECPADFVDWPLQSADAKPYDLMAEYAASLRAAIQKGIDPANPQPLAGRHLIVDAGNGAGGYFATDVLEPLGADISGSQFLNPDGTFPNHEPNPDNKAAMASIQKAVLDHQADLGIIFDTDVDRAAVVDASGQTFNRNNLIGLISAILLREHPGATIVTNSATSNHLEDFIQKEGGKLHRYLTGYRNVINEAERLNDAGEEAVLAIETSGHAALKENYMLDDGAYLVARLIIEDAKRAQEGQTLTDLIADLKQPVETSEIRYEIKPRPYQDTGLKLIADFKDYVRQYDDIEVIEDHIEGMRVNFDGADGKGWFLVRLSLHEPLLVWTLEGDTPGSVEKMINRLKHFFEDAADLL